MTQPTDERTETEREADRNAEESRPVKEEVEYLEYLGDPMYGTEFLTSHTISAADAKKAEWVTEVKEPIVWTRRESGRYKGRMLLPLADLPEGIDEELKGDPAFRVATLKG